MSASDYVPCEKESKAPASAIKTAKDLLRNTTVQSLVAPIDIKQVNAKDSLISAWKLMHDGKFLSAPVFDTRKKTHINFVDVLDIVAHCLKSENAVDLENTTCAEVAGLNDRNKFLPVEEKASVALCLSKLLDHNVHRLPIVSGVEIDSMLTESRAVAFVADNASLFGDLLAKTVGDLKLGYKEVKTVKPDTSAREAFSLIASAGIGAVAVVNDGGEVCGNLSASDLRAIDPTTENPLKALDGPVEAFLKSRSDEAIAGPVCVNPKTTVEELLVKLQETKVHRVYVVGDDGKLVGVISLRDVVRLVHSSIQ